MSFAIATDKIAQLLGAPSQNVAAYWPSIETALDSLGGGSNMACIAALATIRVECPTFKPSAEKYNGDPQVYFQRYDGRADLGNNTPGDGFKYRGRGFVQITGKANYQHYGQLLGVDLVNNPDAALDASTAASIFAAYFQQRHIAVAAEAKDWQRVRRAVNGGLNGFDDFMKYVNALLAGLA